MQQIRGVGEDRSISRKNWTAQDIIVKTRSRFTIQSHARTLEEQLQNFQLEIRKK